LKKPSVIVRIDDRLIHGQVLIAWGSSVPIKTFVVADDEIAANEWEKNLLLMAVPEELRAEVLTLEAATKYILESQNNTEASMILIDSPFQLEKMADFGLPPMEINVGGIHYKEGRKEFLPYFFLSPGEIESFKKLMHIGFTFTCQDVPTGAKYNLEKLLEKKG